MIGPICSYPRARRKRGAPKPYSKSEVMAVDLDEVGDSPKKSDADRARPLLEVRPRLPSNANSRQQVLVLYQ